MMSNIKVGDKVRFLNSTGGGVVRSFKGKDQVLVEDEDGFEVPALIRECVVVGDSEMQVHSSRRSPLPSVTQAAVPQPKKPEPQPEVEKVTETIEGERLNIYLAYLPIEPAKVIQGSGYETYFINDSNYSLIDCNAGTIKEIAEKFHNIIITNNEETIWSKQYVNKDLNADNWVRNRVALLHGPNGYHNWAGTAPTHDLVMAFETEEGKILNTLLKPGESTTENPYMNREPRFYATIGYDGAEWGRPRASDGAVFDATPLGNLQFGYYELSEGGNNVNAIYSVDDDNNPIKQEKFNGMVGVDTRMGQIENWNGTYTGYLEKKLIDGSVAANEHNFQTCPMPYIRLAEMYLIAAEACIELNKLDEAVIYIDAIRGRIGRPDTKATLAVRGQTFNQSDLREFLRHERRVELTYEHSRYYDIRRWMIAPEIGNKKLTGVSIVGRLKPGKTASLPYVHDEEVYNYTWTVLNLNYIEKRKWDNKMYFAPIKLEETLRNPAIIQNPYYE